MDKLFTLKRIIEGTKVWSDVFMVRTGLHQGSLVSRGKNFQAWLSNAGCPSWWPQDFIFAADDVVLLTSSSSDL